jgi:hypothetical protein
VSPGEGAPDVVATLVRAATARDVLVTMASGRVVHETGSAPPVGLEGYAAARAKLGLKG